MAEDTRTTRYLYEFATSGIEATQQQIAQFSAALRQMEADMQASMNRMAQAGGGTTTTPAAATFSIPADIRAQQAEAIRRAEELRRAMAATATTSGGGAGQLRIWNEEIADGVLRSRVLETALNDQAKTVVRTKEVWNQAGDRLGQYTTTSWKTADGVRRTTTEIEGMNKIMDEGSALSGRFFRHLTWIGQGLMIWAGINLVSESVNRWVDAQTTLNSALAEFQMRTGATGPQLEQFREQVRQISIETATRPSVVAPALTYADPATGRQAARLRMVAGGDQQELTSFLIAQQAQYNITAEETERILNALAVGWQMTNIPMNQFITMLRDAAPLATEFGMSMEQMYNFMGALQKVTAAEGRELDFFLRSLDKVYDADVQQTFQMRGLDFQTTWVNQAGQVEKLPLVDALKQLHGLVQQGKIDLTELAGLLGMPEGRVQTVQFEKLMMSFGNFIALMDKAGQSTTTFTDLFNTKMDSTKTKSEQLSSAWERLLIAIGDTGPYNVAIEGLTGLLEALEAVLAQDLEGFAKRWDMAFDPKRIFELLHAPGPLGFLSVLFRRQPESGRLPPVMLRPSEDMLPLSMQQKAGAAEGPAGPIPLPSFPSMFNVPQGVSFDEVVRGMNQWTEAFKALGPDYERWIATHQETALVWDENTRTLRMLSGFLPALQRAIAENTQAQKQAALQVGLRNVDLNLATQGGLLQQWVQYYTQFLSRMGFPQEPQAQLVLGENDTFMRLWASNEALMLALRALTEATEEQTDVLSGMWNVPEGATMWVPIQSLFYSRKPGGETSTGPMPLPPTTLPPQQPDWMKLPGAVEQMSVGNMTVTNWEGLDVIIPETPDPTTAIDTVLNRWEEATERQKYAYQRKQYAETRGLRVGAELEQVQVSELEIQATGLELTAMTMDVTTPHTETTTPYSQITSSSMSGTVGIADLYATTVNFYGTLNIPDTGGGGTTPQPTYDDGGGAGGGGGGGNYEPPLFESEMDVGLAGRRRRRGFLALANQAAGGMASAATPLMMSAGMARRSELYIVLDGEKLGQFVDGKTYQNIVQQTRMKAPM